MKNYKIIVEFRVAYRKLGYFQSGMKIWDLLDWTEQWVIERNLPKELTCSFQDLALAYMEMDCAETDIVGTLRKRRG